MEENPIPLSSPPHPGNETLEDTGDASPRASYTGSSRTPFLIDTSGALNSSSSGTTPTLTFFNGLALVVGLQIGSGIFFAPSQVSNHVPSPGAGVLVWFVGGLLVWTGASSFIELGIAIPKNGGIQEYLTFCYGDFAGFLFSLMYLVIPKPAANAMIATVFSEHVCNAFLPSHSASVWVVKPVAVGGLWVITVVNCLGARTGALVANCFLILKFFLLSSIVFIGLAVAIKGTGNGVPRSSGGWFGDDAGSGKGSLWLMVGGYVTALYGALFCYGGWETVCMRSRVCVRLQPY
jgi:L-type amino acid transporter 6